MHCLLFSKLKFSLEFDVPVRNKRNRYILKMSAEGSVHNVKHSTGFNHTEQQTALLSVLNGFIPVL